MHPRVLVRWRVLPVITVGAVILGILPGGTQAGLSGVFCATRSNCLSVGARGTVLESTDGGMTWTSDASSTTQNLYAATCTTNSSCLATGANDTVLRAPAAATERTVTPPIFAGTDSGD